MSKKVAMGTPVNVPGIDDKQNSLSISEGADRSILIYCHAGCNIERIISSLGLNYMSGTRIKELKTNGLSFQKVIFRISKK